MEKKAVVYSLLEFFDEIFVNFQAEILHSSLLVREHDRRGVIRQLAFGFSVAANQRVTCQNGENAPFNCTSRGVLHAHKPQVVPNLLQQVVEVPAVVS